MKRFSYVQSAIFGLLCALFLASCQPKDIPQAAFKNVVVVISDDHSSRTVGSYGNALIRTPNIDRLAGEGVQFNRAYCNAPICSASRQSLLTGRYPHATGVNLLFTPFNDDLNYTMAEHFQSHGLATAMIGKTHWNDWIYYNYWDEWPTFGFDTVITRAQWKAQLETDPPDPLPPGVATRANAGHEDGIPWLKNAAMLPVPYRDKDSEGTFLAENAIRFMRAHQEEGFFVWLAFHEPHAPFAFPLEYAASYDPSQLPLPVGSEEDQRWVPEIFRDLSEEERRGIIASYYTSVEYMDKNLGLVLDELEQSGLQEQTLVVYLSDHGYLLNDHSRFEKHSMWAEAVEAPLVFSGSGLARNLQSQQLVEFVDLAPTLYDALGLPAPEGLQGHSLMPLLRGQDAELREHAFTTYLEDNMAMVASREWKYIFTTGKRDLGLGYATGKGPSGVVHMLYDLKQDPAESKNLAYDPAHAPRVDRMQKVMLQRFMDTHPMAAYVPSGLNTTGKLIWFCEPGDIGEEPGSDLQRIFESDKIYR